MLVAVVDRAVAVILEAVDAALRIFLHEHTLRRIAVIVGVLLALAVARTVVRRIVGVVHATLTRRRLLVAGIAGRGQLRALRIQQRAVGAGLFKRYEPAWKDGSNTQNEQ